MKRIILPLIILATVSVNAQRTIQSLNFGWDFRLNNTGEWRKIDIPHDFQIEQPWVVPAADEKPDNNDVAANIKSRLSSRGFKEMGKGYYRYNLKPDASLQGQRILLDFEGIMYTADVILNGKRVGGTDYGYVGFEIDVSDQLKCGEENLIEVIADTREPENSRWYTGGGLFRNVSMIATPKDLFFQRHPLYITTRDNKYVSISAEFTNKTRDTATRIALKILSPGGETIYNDTVSISRHRMARTQEARIATDVEIKNPQLWDIDSPYLYQVKVRLLREDGSVADETDETFGIRTVEFGPEYGLKLNGRKVLLKGYANHHTMGALGAAAYPRAIEKRILMMKQWGVNHIRTSHNPYSRDFIRLCDKHGILVVDELYDKWTRQHTGGKIPFENHWQQEVPEWVKRDRNSPSVVLWSLGNELQQDPNQPFNDFGVTMYKLQKTLLQRYDSTRLVTVAMHPRFRNWETDSLPCALAMETDIQAYNYRYMYFPGDGRRFPWMTFYQSEANTSGMGPNFFEMNLDKVVGLAYWGAIDYLGESQGWPTKGWAQGVFDISLEPKPKAWLMRSLFKPEEPLVHIAVIDSKNEIMWNGVQTGNDGMSDHWNRQPGSKLDMITYTNADEVELMINGNSLGRKQNVKNDPKQRNQIKWNGIVYEEGKLEAIAYNDGKIVARHQTETTSKAVRLMATPDNAHWLADGTDLQHIRIEAVDSMGRRVPMAQDELRIEVSGDARIVAVTSGNHNSDELNVSNHRRLWNGSAMVILRSGKTPSSIKLKINTDTYKPLVLELETEENWQLVWSDEFNGSGAPDSTIWNFEEGFVRNHEDQWYQKANAYEKDGLLVIEGRKEHHPNPTYDPQSSHWGKKREFIDYSSACLNTRGKQEFLFGRMEVRAKIPTAGGAWPAIWTLGSNMEWPSCGEIDIMEYYRIKGIPHILANACWGNDNRWDAVWNSQKIPFKHFTDKDPDWANKFHLWRMDWNEDQIQILLDGELLNEIQLKTTKNGHIGKGTNPFLSPHYILLNLALGGDNGGIIDDKSLPIRYEIDYVRIYKKL